LREQQTAGAKARPDFRDLLARLKSCPSQARAYPNATPSPTTFYRQCPFINIDVKSTASSHDEELPTDKIA